MHELIDVNVLRDDKLKAERDKIMEALNAAGRSMTKAAQALGCSRYTLYRRIARYNLRAKSANKQEVSRG